MPDLAQAREAMTWLSPLDLQALPSLEAMQAVLPQFPPHTLLTRDFFEAMLQEAGDFNLPPGGDWAQVGVWRGGGALFLRALMDDLGLGDRLLHLFDAFSELDAEALSRPGDRAFVQALGGGAPMDNETHARQLLRRFGHQDSTRVIRCDITDDNAGVTLPPLSFLHIDVDFYEPTRAALSKCYDRVLPGGIIVIDDYFLDLVHCREATEDFIHERSLADEVSLQRFSSFSVLVKKT
ncbi:TylF/MycF/NovP-related O-methyltransferase [Alcanivorax quisquiliarum]|uniref:TylF/MycF family methyltransferase n=1 Tax=Alcanivorax quisquiliarum TaxID=2933565 RepID=A0ABT0E3P8_9GAMM|nr:TylF/MycF/NovP-related O-methyltransferase [Alcanivorax quisquiliarum]MCK0536388.1 TylF/MycF family methyltransferase [Alcanivorax quisquiliarum]